MPLGSILKLIWELSIVRTYDSRKKKSSTAPLVQTQALNTHQPAEMNHLTIQAKSNEEGLAEWEAQRQKWERFGSPWMDKAPNPSSKLAQPWIQQKLRTGKSGDQYERKANRFYSQMEIGETSSKLESSITRMRGGGQPLDSKLHPPMGQLMGADLSGVRVHTDARSDQLNQSIQAKAFTTGQDVFYRSGAYMPESQAGQELIAHELAHVVQQGCNHQIQRKVVKVNHKEGKEKTSFDYVASAEVNSMVKALKQDTGQEVTNFYKDQDPYVNSEEHYFAGHGGNNGKFDDMEPSEFASKIKDRVEENAILHLISCALGEGEEESFASQAKNAMKKSVTVTGTENFVFYSKNIKAIYEEPDFTERVTGESFEDLANPIFGERDKAERTCDRKSATKIAEDINTYIAEVIKDYDEGIKDKDEEGIKNLHTEIKKKILTKQQVDDFANAVSRDETLQKDKVTYRLLDKELNDFKKIKNYAEGLEKAIRSLAKKNQGFLMNVETIIIQLGDKELTTKVETQIKNHKQQSDSIWQTFEQAFEKLLSEWNKKGANLQEVENFLEDEVESEENEVEIAATLQKHLEKYKRFN